MHEEPAQAGAVKELVGRPVVEHGRRSVRSSNGVEDIGAVQPAPRAYVLHPQTESIRGGPLGEEGVQGREVLIVAGGTADQEVVAPAAGERVGARAANDQVAARAA